MIAINGRVIKHGQSVSRKIMIPANQSEAMASNTDNLGLTIAGVLLLVAVGLVCLLAFGTH